MLADELDYVIGVDPHRDTHALALGGAAALLDGLWQRPHARGLGDALTIAGALVAAIWFWAIVMTPLAIVVIVGVLVSRVRAPAPVAGAP